MAKVNGVLGPIDTEDLGFTLMHEHIMVVNWAMRQAFADWYDRERHVERTVAELVSAKERGVRTFVDLTPIDLGRDVFVMREIAEKAEMQIIAATGFYWTENTALENWPIDRLVEFLLRDIEKGIQGTDVKAGIIKCATDRLGVTDFNEKLLRVAARVHRATGVPISTHTSAVDRVGPAQQDIFQQEGVDLSRVIIGHCGDTDDLEYLESILALGSSIGMDRFGLDVFLPMEKRVRTVAELCRRGRADRMVLSHDVCCQFDFFLPELRELRSSRWNLRHIPDDVIPALRKEGVDERQLRELTVDNPRRIFENQGAY